MITKTAVATGDNLEFKRNSNYFPDYDPERQMTKEQKQRLIELIYFHISNPKEVERRLAEMENYDHTDADEAINDFLFAPWK